MKKLIKKPDNLDADKDKHDTIKAPYRSCERHLYERQQPWEEQGMDPNLRPQH